MSEDSYCDFARGQCPELAEARAKDRPLGDPEVGLAMLRRENDGLREDILESGRTNSHLSGEVERLTKVLALYRLPKCRGIGQIGKEAK